MPTRRLALVLLGTAISAVAAPARAAGQLVDVELVDRSENRLLPMHRYGGAAWVAGQPGNRYAIRLANRSAGRVLVVLSVDGVNAISGDTAALGQTGYVLGPYARAEITGWRKSLSEAAAFYFTTLPDSYAARTDRPENVGVIGAAIFRERASRPEPDLSAAPLQRQTPSRNAAGEAGASAKSAAPESSSLARDRADAIGELRAERRLGTGHGERLYSPTSSVAFERASREPAEIVRVRYDSLPRLVAMGVIDGGGAAHAPEAFPRFAPDPR